MMKRAMKKTAAAGETAAMKKIAARKLTEVRHHHRKTDSGTQYLPVGV